MLVLITGSEGFIGQHLTRELEANGHTVLGVDIADTAGQDLTKPFVIDTLLNIYKPNQVIHLAAQVGREFGEDDVAHTIEANALMTTRVAQACGKFNIPLLYASTSEVYGDQGEKWLTEDMPCKLPHNLYGLTKRWGEETCQLYAPRGLKIVRLSMPFGAGLPAGRGRAAIINFLYNALHGKEITVHRDSERCWCYIDDTVRGIRMVMEYPMFLIDSGIYNIGRADNPTSMEDVARIACKLTGADLSLITLMDAPRNQTTIKRLSNAKLCGLGWSHTVNLEEGMKRTLEFVKTLD